MVLVGLNSPVLKKEENADEDTMEELSALVETAGGETVGHRAAEPAVPGPPDLHRGGQGGGGAALLREHRRHHGDFRQ